MESSSTRTYIFSSVDISLDVDEDDLARILRATWIKPGASWIFLLGDTKWAGAVLCIANVGGPRMGIAL